MLTIQFTLPVFPGLLSGFGRSFWTLGGSGRLCQIEHHCQVKQRIHGRVDRGHRGPARGRGGRDRGRGKKICHGQYK